jgi:hypothetical protein
LPQPDPPGAAMPILTIRAACGCPGAGVNAARFDGAGARPVVAASHPATTGMPAHMPSTARKPPARSRTAPAEVGAASAVISAAASRSSPGGPPGPRSRT